MKAVKPISEMLNMPMPVARVAWKAMPDFLTGAHHTILSYDYTAEMMGVEFAHINENTTTEELKKRFIYGRPCLEAKVEMLSSDIMNSNKCGNVY